MRSGFTRARVLRVVAIVAVMLSMPVAATANSVIGKGSSGPGWAPSLGEAVSDLSALPAATRSEAHVLPNSEPLSRAELEAVQGALTPGYRAAGILRAGDALAVALLYMPEASSEGVLLALRGTFGPTGVTFLPQATAVGLVEDAGDVLEITGLDGVVRSFNMSDPVACFFMWVIAIGVVLGCMFGPLVVDIICTVTSIDERVVEETMNSDACAHAPIDVSPNSQTVGNAQRATFEINGHNYVPADRSITVPYATCSGPGCSTNTTASDAVDKTYHWFYPLIACCSTQTKTVYGTIYYETGWQSEGVSLTVTP